MIEANTDTYVYNETWKDKLISYNGQSITYDAVGNPTDYMGNELTWTMGRQLASFGSNTYTYNEDGIRTSKTVNGVKTTFLLDGYNIIEQTDGTTTLHFFYDSVGEIVGFKYNGNNYLYVKNSMGDIVGIADAVGNLIASYTYDAWGKVTSVTGSNTAIGELNPFRYRSYYYDSDIQMYYLQSRYYDPEIGRFINSDEVLFIGANTLSITCNPFVYCNNNSKNICDYSGYWGADIHYGKSYNEGTFRNKNGQICYYDGTYEWLIEMGIDKNVAHKIADACRLVDKSFFLGPVNPTGWGYHFTYSNKNDTRLKNAKKRLNTAINEYIKGKKDNAYEHLGIGLHALQDIFAHGYFFPLGVLLGLDNKLYTTIQIHSSEYDNPFYDWKNEGYSFKPIDVSLTDRYYDTKNATQEYIVLFLFCASTKPTFFKLKKLINSFYI